MVEYEISKGATTEDIITLVEAKANQKIDYDDEDSNLQLLVDGTAELIEEYTGRIIRQRTVSVFASAWAKNMELPVGTISAITEVKYTDEDGAEQTLAAESYHLYKYDPYKRIFFLKIDDFPNLDPDLEFPIEIVATAGFFTADVPKDIKNAALLLFGFAEQYREELPLGGNRTAARLLRNHKRF